MTFAPAISGLAFCAVATTAFIAVAQPVATKPLSPVDALSRFQLEPGLTIELVAAEPLVQSPAAIAWDEAHRLFVAENTGYPEGPKTGQPPQGKIIELRDANADGRSDQRVEFATELHFPNGLVPWRGGWLVTDAPHLYWLVDTNHDGRSDLREIWFTGFATNQSTQLRACYPVLGPDGWIYIARGWSAGQITSPKWPHLPPVDLKNGDFRFRPDGSAAEAIGGNAQFGMVLDDVGRRFLTSNRNPIMHAVAWPHWWKRMPNFYFSEIIQDVSPVGADAKVFPISADLTTSGFMPELMSAPHAGTFTSACGLHQFFGEALPEKFQASWFICEPAQNLVQRQIMVQDGPTFRSQRATEGRDFLASSDTWFHPVYAATGPSGALYIADMYRNFIDHPEYLPADARTKIDFESGKDRGRIWRILASKPNIPPPLTNASPAQLASAIASENIWRRQTAHRLILENPTAAIITHLLNTFPDFQENKIEGDPMMFLQNRIAAHRAEDPALGPHLGRARAVQLLADLSLHHRKNLSIPALNAAARPIINATVDNSPTVRESAFRVLQVTSTRANPIPEVPLELWINDPNPAVRFHLAYSLGQGDYPRMTDGLVATLRRDAADRWTRATVLSGLKERMLEFAERWLGERPPVLPGVTNHHGFDNSDFSTALAYDFGRVYGQANAYGSEIFLRRAFAPEADGSAWQPALLSGFVEAGNRAVKERLRNEFDERVLAIQRHCITNALNTTTPLHHRIAAARFLGHLTDATHPLLQLVTGAHPKELRLSAARALARTSEFGLPDELFDGWRQLPVEAREIFLEAIVAKPERAAMLLDAVERGDIPTWQINANRRRTLLQHANQAIRNRAEAALGSASRADRAKVFEQHKSVLSLTGDATKGRNVFLNLCASCHQHGKEGHKVGPDLTGIRNQPSEAILYHIIVPDAEIYAGFQNYEVETSDGDHFNGLLVEETSDGVTLVRALGEKQRIDRSRIVHIRSSASSLMPSELEKAMNPNELADLLAFLKSAP